MSVRVFPQETYREPFCATHFHDKDRITSRYNFGFAKTTRSDITTLFCQFECFRRKRIENFFVQPIFLTKTESLLDTFLAPPKPLEMTL